MESKVSDKEKEDGIFLRKRIFSEEQLQSVRQAIINTILIVDGKEANSISLNNQLEFKEVTTKMIHKIFKRKPYLRRVIPGIFRNLPEVKALSNHTGIQRSLEEVGVLRPIERSVSVQLWLPWETIFHEKLHQDIGGIISENSWTVQVPLHNVNKDTGAAEIYPGTHKLGVIPLKLVRDDSNGFLYETCGEKHTKGTSPMYTEIEYTDAFFFRCLNIHQTSEFQNEIRWSIVIRFDDLSQSPILKNGHNPYNNKIRSYDFKAWEDQLETFLTNYNVK